MPIIAVLLAVRRVYVCLSPLAHHNRRAKDVRGLPLALFGRLVMLLPTPPLFVALSRSLFFLSIDQRMVLLFCFCQRAICFVLLLQILFA